MPAATVAAHDQRLTLAVPAEGDQVAVGDALADRAWPARRSRTPPPARRRRTGLERRREQQVAPRSGRRGRARRPAADRGRPSRRPRAVSPRKTGPSTARTRTAAARSGSPSRRCCWWACSRRRRCRRPGRPGGGDRELLEVGGVERRLVGRRGELVGRGGPRLPREGVASPVESAGRGGRLPPGRIRRPGGGRQQRRGAGDTYGNGARHRPFTAAGDVHHLARSRRGCDRGDTAWTGCS